MRSTMVRSALIGLLRGRSDAVARAERATAARIREVLDRARGHFQGVTPIPVGAGVFELRIHAVWRAPGSPQDCELRLAFYLLRRSGLHAYEAGQGVSRIGLAYHRVHVSEGS